MYFNFSEPFAQLLLLLRCDILVTEEHNTALGNKQAKLIALLVVQVLQLKTDDLCSDMLCEIDYFLRSRK